jgi:hypothetical protein
MPIKLACLAALMIAGCSRSSPPRQGHVVVVMTIDWEGASLSPEGLDAIDDLRRGLDDVPMTHFVSAAYFTKDKPEPKLVSSIVEAVHRGDQLAVHLHAWRSLAKASGIAPRLSPSFLTGTDQLAELEDGDTGFDVDLDTYSIVELRAQLRTSRQLLEQTRVPVSKSFRAGGYLATPKVLAAIHDEGYTVDSSAIDYRQLDEMKDEVLPQRLHEVWPNIDPSTQPFYVKTLGGELLEIPIAAVVDYATTAEVIRIIESAHARLQTTPSKDVFVVLAFHLETADSFADRLRAAMLHVRSRPDLANDLMFTTIDHAEELARSIVVR